MPLGRRSIAWFSPDPRGDPPARRPARLAARCAAALRALRGPPRHLLRRGDGALRRSAPARRLDHAEVRQGLPAPAPAGLGPLASSATPTASWSAASTACASAASSPASRCSTRRPTRPRSPSSRSSTGCARPAPTLLDVQWMTPHLRSLGAVELPRARVPRAGSTAAVTGWVAPAPRARAHFAVMSERRPSATRRG